MENLVNELLELRAVTTKGLSIAYAFIFMKWIFVLFPTKKKTRKKEEEPVCSPAVPYRPHGDPQMLRFGAHLVLVLRYLLTDDMKGPFREELMNVGDLIIHM